MQLLVSSASSMHKPRAAPSGGHLFIARRKNESRHEVQLHPMLNASQVLPTLPQPTRAHLLGLACDGSLAPASPNEDANCLVKTPTT